MTVLGAVLAGGASSRFGADKAAAQIDGMALLDHVVAGVAPQVAALVVVGRDWRGLARVDDLPAPGLGPLGGLCAALLHAAATGHDAVLCVPCDTLGLPADLVMRLSPGPAIASGHRSIGLWPSSLGPALLSHLAGGGARGLHVWASACDAREADCGPLYNINRPDELPRTKLPG